MHFGDNSNNEKNRYQYVIFEPPPNNNIRKVSTRYKSVTCSATYGKLHFSREGLSPTTQSMKVIHTHEDNVLLNACRLDDADLIVNLISLSIKRFDRGLNSLRCLFLAWQYYTEGFSFVNIPHCRTVNFKMIGDVYPNRCAAVIEFVKSWLNVFSSGHNVNTVPAVRIILMLHGSY